MMEEIVSRLNIEFKSFLENEGKWLGGDFSVIFEKARNEDEKDLVLIKMSVYRMLPYPIKNELQKYLDLKGIKYINI